MTLYHLYTTAVALFWFNNTGFERQVDLLEQSRSSQRILRLSSSLYPRGGIHNSPEAFGISVTQSPLFLNIFMNQDTK